jgi:hypothetical protein
MRALIVSFAIATFCTLAPSTQASPTSSVPTIKGDPKHFLKNVPCYVPATKQVWLDCSALPFAKDDRLAPSRITLFTVVKPESTRTTASSVEYALDSTLNYAIAWKRGVSRYTLDAKTLKPMADTCSFQGFKAGETWELSVEKVEKYHPNGNPASSKCYWRAFVIVR